MQLVRVRRIATTFAAAAVIGVVALLSSGSAFTHHRTTVVANGYDTSPGAVAQPSPSL